MSTDFNPNDYIDQDLIADAEQRFRDLLKRKTEAPDTIAAARAAVVTAETALNAAIVGGDAKKARQVLGAARTALQDLIDEAAVVENAFVKAQQVDLPAAKRKAHAKLAAYSLDLRMAAARDADVARAALADAERRSVEATALFGTCGYGDSATQEMTQPIRVPNAPHSFTSRWPTAVEEEALQATLRAQIQE
jgi:hypothetical protein